MPRITEYKRGNISPNSVFLIDGAGGTSTITAKDVAIELLKLLDSKQQVSNLDMNALDQITSLIPSDKVLVGTEDGVKAMSAKNALFEVLDIDSTISVEMRKNIFRGNNLGDTFTEEQKKEIRDGTFRGLFVGDYWEKNGIRWRIVDIDYYYGVKLDDSSNWMIHHVIIMPDQTFTNICMNSTDSTGLLYKNTEWVVKTNGPKEFVYDKIYDLFGSNGDTKYYDRICVPIGSYNSNKGTLKYGDFMHESLFIPTAEQIVGFQPTNSGPINEYHSLGIPFDDSVQFDCFRLTGRLHTIGISENGEPTSYILNNVIEMQPNTTRYAAMYITALGSTNVTLHGIRPAFGLTGL